MKRKVIQLAGRTLVISLPNKWVKQRDILKGDELEVHEQKNSLIISQTESNKTTSTDIDIGNKEPMIKRILGSIYKAGYNECNITFKKTAEFETAQSLIREAFIGFEVIEQRKSTLKAKDLSSANPEEFNSILRRMFRIMLSMADDSAEAFEKKDKDWLKAIALRDKDVNKLSDFLRRIINKGLYNDTRLGPTYSIIEQLEKISDLYRDITVLKPTPANIQLLKKTNSFLREFYDLYYNFNLEAIAEFGSNGKTLIKELKKQKQDEMVFNIKSIAQSIYDLNGPLMASRL